MEKQLQINYPVSSCGDHKWRETGSVELGETEISLHVQLALGGGEGLELSSFRKYIHKSLNLTLSNVSQKFICLLWC